VAVALVVGDGTRRAQARLTCTQKPLILTRAASAKARLADLGAEPMSMISAEFGKLIAAETEKWAKVIRVVNIKPE
jgi:hypothetical protein